MLVKDLVALLSAMPQDAEVVLNMWSNEPGYGLTVDKVEVVDACRWTQGDSPRPYQWTEYWIGMIRDDTYEYATIVNINT